MMAGYTLRISPMIKYMFGVRRMEFPYLRKVQNDRMERILTKKVSLSLVRICITGSSRLARTAAIRVVYEGGFEGKHLNGPNDLWMDHKGGIYFTDPYYHRDYWEAGHKQDAGY